MLIRRASRDDSLTIWNIRSIAISAQCQNNYPADIIEKWAAGGPPENFESVVEHGFWVAENAGEVIGIGKINLETGKVDAMFVHPQKMRQGIGAKMLRHLERLASDRGLTEMTLNATLNAEPFYRACGFVGSEIVQYNSPMGLTLDCILMSKKIA